MSDYVVPISKREVADNVRTQCRKFSPIVEFLAFAIRENWGVRAFYNGTEPIQNTTSSQEHPVGNMLRY